MLTLYFGSRRASTGVPGVSAASTTQSCLLLLLLLHNPPCTVGLCRLCSRRTPPPRNDCCLSLRLLFMSAGEQLAGGAFFPRRGASSRAPKSIVEAMPGPSTQCPSVDWVRVGGSMQPAWAPFQRAMLDNASLPTAQ